MKLSSVLRLSPELRTNAVFCLLFFVFCSLQTLISSVTLQPLDKIKTLWNNQNSFITCKMDRPDDGGTLEWYRGNSQYPVDENPQAKVYARKSGNQNKLFFVNPGKKYSGIYECRHLKDGKVISSNKFELKVYNAIDMSNTRTSHVGTEGSSFSMHCEARFDQDATDAQLSWRHNNIQIPRKGDPQFSVTPEERQSIEYRQLRSFLRINNLSKDHEGVYLCQADYANAYMTDLKEVEINLRVQFKPRFLEKNHKNVWISDDSQGEVIVNVTCLVNADPVANFRWLTGEDRQIPQTPQLNQGHRDHLKKMPDYTIINTENISVLSLRYQNIGEISSNFNDPEGRLKKFKCIAQNNIGEAKQDFIINIGKLPEAPVLGHTSYENGVLWLSLNQTDVKPEIDLYRVDIDNNIPIYFNESNKVQAATNTTYKIDVNVPSGTHHLTLYAHNPVGWSDSSNPITAHKLVISGATVTQQYLVSSMVTLLASALALRYTH